MSLNSVKNITRRSWDTIPMPGTVISCLSELVYNEPDRLIFTDQICCPIGDIKITGVARVDTNTNENQPPQGPPHELNATETAEEEPVIPDTEIDLDINHETPT